MCTIGTFWNPNHGPHQSTALASSAYRTIGPSWTYVAQCFLPSIAINFRPYFTYVCCTGGPDSKRLCHSIQLCANLAKNRSVCVKCGFTCGRFGSPYRLDRPSGFRGRLPNDPRIAGLIKVLLRVRRVCARECHTTLQNIQ